MLLNENIDTANFPSHIRRKIYEIEKLVRLGQRSAIQVYTNCLYESDFLQWEVFYNPKKDELYIIVRSLIQYAPLALLPLSVSLVQVGAY